MKLYLRNKIVSLGEGSKVLDENEKPYLIVKGRVISPTRVKTIRDLDGKVLYKVRNKLWRFMKKSAYIMDKKGKILMQIKEKHAILGKGFDVLRTNEVYNIERGSITSGMINIFKDDELLCAVKKKIFALIDSFELNFENEEDAALLVAMTIAIDNIYDDDDD